MRSAEEIWDEACKGGYSSYPEVGRAAIEQAQREAIEAAAKEAASVSPIFLVRRIKRLLPSEDVAQGRGRRT